MRFGCRTTFDITATGVVGHFKSARLPFKDRVGQNITDADGWNQARNQQRNWETLTQLISLRAQIFDLTDPVKDNNFWSFEFEVETSGIFGPDDNPVSVLCEDAAGIPMIDIGQTTLSPILVTLGPDQNIWFELIEINNS
jgi:hypothetical protein